MTSSLKVFKMGPSPHELKPDQIVRIVNESASKDWLFFKEEDVYCYRHDLLIRLEKDPEQPKHYLVYYGDQSVGIVRDVDAVMNPGLLLTMNKGRVSFKGTNATQEVASVLPRVQTRTVTGPKPNRFSE